MGPTASRRSLVDRADPLTVRRQCGLLGVSRCSVYYAPKGERAEPGEDAADDDPPVLRRRCRRLRRTIYIGDANPAVSAVNPGKRALPRTAHQ